MTTLSEGTRPGAYIVFEVGMISRDQVTIAAGDDLLGGTVLGKLSGTGKYVPLAPSANDGSEDAAGILFADAPAADEDVEAAATTRLTEVQDDMLVWPDGITDNEKAAAVAALAALMIIVRLPSSYRKGGIND